MLTSLSPSGWLAVLSKFRSCSSQFLLKILFDWLEDHIGDNDDYSVISREDRRELVNVNMWMNMNVNKFMLNAEGIFVLLTTHISTQSSFSFGIPTEYVKRIHCYKCVAQRDSRFATVNLKVQLDSIQK